jgi:hypothetical protein
VPNNVVWIDETNADFAVALGHAPGTDLPEAEFDRCRLTLAASIEIEAEDNEGPGGGSGEGLIVGRELRRLAARVRASGCRTAEEWLAREPLA